jgi:hypothetical protein
MQQGGYCHASNGASYDFAELNDVLWIGAVASDRDNCSLDDCDLAS